MFWVTWLHRELQGQSVHLELDGGPLGFVFGPLFSVYNSSLNDFITDPITLNIICTPKLWPLSRTPDSCIKRPTSHMSIVHLKRKFSNRIFDFLSQAPLALVVPISLNGPTSVLGTSHTIPRLSHIKPKGKSNCHVKSEETEAQGLSKSKQHC